MLEHIKGEVRNLKSRNPEEMVHHIDLARKGILSNDDRLCIGTSVKVIETISDDRTQFMSRCKGAVLRSPF